MTVALYLPLIAVALLGSAGPWLARRLPPATAAAWLTLAAVVAAGTSVGTLGLLAMTALVRIPQVAARGRLSPTVLGHDPVSSAAGFAALGLLLTLLPFALRAARRVWQDSARTYRLARALSDRPDGLAVVTDPRPQAFAVPALPAVPGHAAVPARIVATDSLLRTLDPAQRKAMLAHEQAHLTRRHHWYLLAANLAAVLNPLLFRIPDAVTEATERWADEDAARAVGDRGVVARALGRAALSSLPRTVPGMAQAHVGTRVRALLGPPPPRRRWLGALVGLALLGTAGAALEAAHETEQFFDAARQAWRVAHDDGRLAGYDVAFRAGGS